MKKHIFIFLVFLGTIAFAQAQVNLTGLIRTPTDQPISQAEVELLNADNQLLAVATSGADGRFVFNDLPQDSSYFLRVSRDINYLDGVSTFDVVMIARHILGVERFPDPYQVIASDVNLTGSVTTLDLIEMRRLILGLVNVFPAEAHWVFVPDQNLSGTPDQVLSSLKELIEVPVTGSFVEVNVKGIKLGDVNYTDTVN
jgi:hypothetical protein